ncbi:uncharacterized protein LOC131067888 [Cryptomeria japonica]|uniref:uncharacterized protein LOC131067888 n=1 Tax=Cryptomeria japonica TaxID=3369 RepID=UPI0025AC43D0|nr:uncharacterized protein LOC131067888 [Cryptomeria japonica]
MGYEVDKDLLTAYADHLLSQLVDTTARASSAPIGTPTSVKTSVGKEKTTEKEKPAPIKKEKPIETKKEKPSKIQFWRKGKIVEPPTAPVKTSKRKKKQAQKLVDVDEEETESEREKKALRTSGKRSKGVGTPVVKSPKKPVIKLTPLENLIINIKEYGILTSVKKLFDKFSKDEQREIEDAIVYMMNKYSKALIELKGKISNSLYNIIDARWQATMKQDREYIEYFLKNLQHEATQEEIDEIFAKAKSSFRSKKGLTRMLIGETQSVHEEIEQIFKKVLGLIPDEEEEVKEDEPKRFKVEDLPKGVKIIEFKPNEIVLDDQPMNTQSELEVIPDDDDTGNNDNVGAPGNVNVQDIDVEMSKQHE